MSFLKKEVLIYIGLLVILAAIQHPDLLTDPFARVGRLINDGQQSVFHPFFWVTPVYMILLMVRLVIKSVRKFLHKKNNSQNKQ